MHHRSVIVFCLLLIASVPACSQDEQKTGDLGNFRLESGQIIEDCRIGYRTHGKANADKSNVILFPTWFTGVAKDLEAYIGPGRLADTSKFMVIAVDALGNGISSSPSRSAKQPGLRFPKFTIRDMVNSQHALLTRVLGIRRLRGVMGISMGGMQTFQWLVSYPEFLEKAVPIVGSPQLAPYDLLLWTTTTRVIEEMGATGVASKDPRRLVALIHALALTTPQRVNFEYSRETFSHLLQRFEGSIERMDSIDYLRQAQAMLAHDIASSSPLESIAARIRAQMLVVVGTQDHVVTPGPALRLAKLTGAQILELTGECGHMVTSCEMGLMAPVVRNFLSK